MEKVVLIICLDVKKVLEIRRISWAIDLVFLFTICGWIALRTVTTPAAQPNKPIEAMAVMKIVQLVDKYAIAATIISAPPNILFKHIKRTEPMVQNLLQIVLQIVANILSLSSYK